MAVATLADDAMAAAVTTAVNLREEVDMLRKEVDFMFGFSGWF
jgi:hypothetical protein